MRYRLSSIALALALAAAPAAGSAADATLYQRLGGHDAIAAFADDFLGRLDADPQLKRFLEPFSDDSRARIRQHLIEFVCAGTGGPCLYTGRDMKTTHKGVGIAKADWDRSMVLIGETAKKLGVPDKESGELAAIVLTLEKDIVDAPAK
jgi:hemoglobin